MTESKPINITDSQFDDMVIMGNGVIVVDFWAPWCGPCHSMAPALEAFTNTNIGKVNVFKLDVDDNPKTAERYEIRSIPTVIYFLDGEPVHIHNGSMTESTLQEKLDAILNTIPDVD